MSADSKAMRTLSPVGIFVGACLAASLAGAEPSPPEVHRAEELLKQMETPSPAMKDSLFQIMERRDLDLLKYMQAHPSDSQAAGVLMRLHDLRISLTHWIGLLSLSGDLEVSDDVAPYIAVVELALLADSTSAELHHYRSRLISFPKLKDGRLSEAPNVNEALREAKKAVEIAPDNPAYRENLAFLLLLAGDERAARDLYRKIDPSHPMYLYLHDWERMPRIEGLVAVDDSMRYLLPITSPLSIMSAGGIRTHVFLGPATAFERNCRKLWPSFRLIPDTNQTHSRYPKGKTRYAQHLRWIGDKLEPDAKPSDVVGGQEPGVGDGGIWMEVVESRALPSDPAGHRPGIKDGEIYCRVEFHNMRL